MKVRKLRSIIAGAALSLACLLYTSGSPGSRVVPVYVARAAERLSRSSGSVQYPVKRLHIQALQPLFHLAGGQGFVGDKGGVAGVGVAAAQALSLIHI